VDHDFAAQLAKLSSAIKISGRGHGEVEGRGEHALEDQLPFVQRVLHAITRMNGGRGIPETLAQQRLFFGGLPAMAGENKALAKMS
jgi:predicted class III extradiol MEMO1 family dioxygenase